VELDEVSGGTATLVSGGVWGLDHGYCQMIGGETLMPLPGIGSSAERRPRKVNVATQYPI
jgi:hypothetical protein